MNLNKLKKEIHNLLVNTDKYKCEACQGFKVTHVDPPKLYKSCETCQGSGIHADTSKLQMDIISQLVFALKAYEDGRFFNTILKDTYEDHLSHSFILLLDFAEYEKVLMHNEIMTREIDFELIDNNIHSNICLIIEQLLAKDSNWVFRLIYVLCRKYNIDLEKHVQARLEYMRGEADAKL